PRAGELRARIRYVVPGGVGPALLVAGFERGVGAKRVVGGRLHGDVRIFDQEGLVGIVVEVERRLRPIALHRAAAGAFELDGKRLLAGPGSFEPLAVGGGGQLPDGADRAGLALRAFVLAGLLLGELQRTALM